MLKWPDRARGALRKLFQPLQDIDVFVEDKNDEAFYRVLLNFATNDEIKIQRVFELGGRKAVVEAAEKHDFLTRPALFIVDGDLPWVSGHNFPLARGLHQHDAYCIENLLFCEQAISAVLSQDLAKAEVEVKGLLAYDQWVASIVPPLQELFAAYATSYLHAPTLPTVSLGVGRLCNQVQKRRTELDILKVKAAAQDVLNQAKAIVPNPKDVDDTFATMYARLSALPKPLMIISGKDYLLPLLLFRLHSLGSGPTTKSLRFRLAGSGDRGRFSALADALRRASAGLP